MNEERRLKFPSSKPTIIGHLNFSLITNQSECIVLFAAVAFAYPVFGSKTIFYVNFLPLSFHTGGCSRLWAFQSTACTFLQPQWMSTTEGIKGLPWCCSISLVKPPSRETQRTQHGGFKALHSAPPDHSGPGLWVPIGIFLGSL